MGSGGSEQYCLRWNNHQSNLLGVFSQLLRDESLVDVTLACSEGHSIRAHKVVLSACSSYFRALFVDHPARHPIVILKDVRFAELRTLVDFMYKGEVNVEYAHLSALLKTAESLKVKGLAEMTRDYGKPDDDPEPEQTEPKELVGRKAPQQQPPPPPASSPPTLDDDGDTLHSPAESVQNLRVCKSPEDRDSLCGKVRYHHLHQQQQQQQQQQLHQQPQQQQQQQQLQRQFAHLSSPQRPPSSAGELSPGASSDCMPSDMSIHNNNSSSNNLTQTQTPTAAAAAAAAAAGASNLSQTCSTIRGTAAAGGEPVQPPPGPPQLQLPPHPPLPNAATSTPVICHRSASSPLLNCEPLPGPSNMPPVQQVPLSLKKEVDWGGADEKPQGESSSDYSRHPHDSDPPQLGGGDARSESPPRLFPCIYCATTFPHQSKLTRHILSHSLETLRCREPQPHPVVPFVDFGARLAGPPHDPPDPTDQPPTPMDLDLEGGGGGGQAGGGGGVVLCKFCGKSFPDVGSLIGHLPVHTGDRPFKCEFCGKAFKLRHHMKDHCRVHTGERPFRCSLCGKTFSRSTILKAHEKTHYPKYVRKFLSPSPLDQEEESPH